MKSRVVVSSLISYHRFFIFIVCGARELPALEKKSSLRLPVVLIALIQWWRGARAGTAGERRALGSRSKIISGVSCIRWYKLMLSKHWEYIDLLLILPYVRHLTLNFLLYFHVRFHPTESG